MISREKGVVLFVVIVLLATITLLILALLQQVLLQIQASNQLVRFHQRLYQLEAAANQLQQRQLSTIDDRCIKHQKTPNEMVDQLQQGHTCEWVVDDNVFVYLLDDLGRYPCLKIQDQHALWSSHHWLLSITTKEAPFALLQIRMTTREDLSVCEQGAKKINNGVLSWRYWGDFKPKNFSFTR